MPKFETNGEIAITIKPKEFFEECSIPEQVALCDLIMYEFDLVEDEEEINTTPPPRSYSEQKFYHNLGVLEDNWLCMDPNDEKIIEILAKKYG